MADYLHVALLDVPEEMEAEFNRLYDTDHVPAMLALDGVHSAKRFRLVKTSIEGVSTMPRYAAMYETDDPDMNLTEEWKATASDTWLRRVRDNVTFREHVVYKRIL